MPEAGDHFAQLGPTPGLGLGDRVSIEPADRLAGNRPPDLEAAFMASALLMLEGDSNILRYSNRARLLDLASRMGIAPFEANLLIERARFRAGCAAGAASIDPKPQLTPPRPRTSWLIALAVALVLDGLLLMALLLL